MLHHDIRRLVNLTSLALVAVAALAAAARSFI